MSARFAIYVRNRNEYENLYSIEFNKYWNIHYDNGKDLFENEDQLVFDSTKYLDEWEIEYDDFIDFMNRIALCLSGAIVIGEYINDYHSIAYCKLPSKAPLHPIQVLNREECNLLELESFFHKYGIEY